MSAPAKTMSVEEYLAFEKTSPIRHEYVDGELLAMAGEKRRHNRIAGNLYRLLMDVAIARNCEVVFEAVKLRVQNTRIRYPDVAVSCAPGNDDYFLENPYFIAEVLSDSTANTDLETKLEEYLRLPTLQRYAIISQDVHRVIVYKRVDGRWELEILNDGAFDVPCLETSVMLKQVYEIGDQDGRLTRDCFQRMRLGRRFRQPCASSLRRCNPTARRCDLIRSASGILCGALASPD